PTHIAVWPTYGASIIIVNLLVFAQHHRSHQLREGAGLGLNCLGLPSRSVHYWSPSAAGWPVQGNEQSRGLLAAVFISVVGRNVSCPSPLCAVLDFERLAFMPNPCYVNTAYRNNWLTATAMFGRQSFFVPECAVRSR